MKGIQQLCNKIELGHGWLRAVAQGCNKTELGINFQMNLNRFGIKLSWGLDGGARWRKVTTTVTIKLNC